MSALRSVVSSARGWLLDPRQPSASTVHDLGSPATKITHSGAIVAPPADPDRLAVPVRPVVAVVPLAPRCGATTLARALAATLARRDHSGAAILIARGELRGSTLAARAAARLAERMGASTVAAGRVCITGADPSGELARLAPLVLDVAHGATPSLQADLTILVVPGDAEPALAELAAQALSDPLTVVTRAADPERWRTRAFAHLPHSRTAAWLAAAGWEPRGAFGAAITKIADACEEAACA